MLAFLIAGASLTPSPVEATMWPKRCASCTILYFCVGDVRANTSSSNPNRKSQSDQKAAPSFSQRAVRTRSRNPGTGLGEAVDLAADDTQRGATAGGRRLRMAIVEKRALDFQANSKQQLATVRRCSGLQRCSLWPRTASGIARVCCLARTADEPNRLISRSTPCRSWPPRTRARSPTG